MKRGVKIPLKEKKEIFDKVISNYLEGNTIESSAESEGISERTFNNWVNEFAEFAEIYKKAKEDYKEKFKQELKAKALTSLEKMVTGWDYYETQEEGIPGKDGKIKTIKTVRKKKHVLPVPSAVFFTLTNIDPENWKNIQTNDIRGKLEIDNLNKVSDEDLDKRIKELESKVGGGKKKKA
ncbi:MAG: hypothetical protein MUC49_15685 [Raineya sp.]|jgi:hypothetical protein|nr:hypothetical protein [Raineya sp.]